MKKSLLRLLQNFSFARATAEKRSFSGFRPKNCIANCKTNRVLQLALFVTICLMAATNIYSQQVDATHEGIANASPGNYIIRSTGERVILNQADIDWARGQLGDTSAQGGQSIGAVHNPNTPPPPSDGGAIFWIAAAAVAALVLLRKLSGRASRRFPAWQNFNRNKTYIDQNGYRRFADTDKAVHRWVAEKQLGRKLYRGEVVHHKNRNKLDNSPDNLQVFASQKEHDREHKESGWY